jgi:hypothetical protein
MNNVRCIVLGAAPKVVDPNLRPIQPLKMLDLFGVISSLPDFDAYNFDTIELVSKDYGYKSESGSERFDVMFAYKGNNRSEGVLILGHWNDGVI